jgi:hypothetical protein
MGVISLDAIKPGMILAGDVKDRNSRALLSTGAEITEKHLRIFKMWGILEAHIQGESKKMPIRKPLRESTRICSVRQRVERLSCSVTMTLPIPSSGNYST